MSTVARRWVGTARGTTLTHARLRCTELEDPSQAKLLHELVKANAASPSPLAQVGSKSSPDAVRAPATLHHTIESDERKHDDGDVPSKVGDVAMSPANTPVPPAAAD